ncbi:adenylyl-sulfate kinase [Paraburkholderia sp. RP-4-7]|uniref:Adenylyl-sulfate kinase n=2 Tax=Paraburkholderia polaris TaxID=2728848 RepID=A0A848IS45_9BURK|nr:adenylyl-sulfate kinase [Paraburkholderia polaris]
MSGAGKPTLACLRGREHYARELRARHPQGKNCRRDLNSDLDFSDIIQHKNIRRSAEVVLVLFEEGHIGVAPIIFPFRADKNAATSIVADDQILKVDVNASCATVEARVFKRPRKMTQQEASSRFTLRVCSQSCVAVERSRACSSRCLEQIFLSTDFFPTTANSVPPC